MTDDQSAIGQGSPAAVSPRRRRIRDIGTALPSEDPPPRASLADLFGVAHHHHQEGTTVLSPRMPAGAGRQIPSASITASTTTTTAEPTILHWNIVDPAWSTTDYGPGMGITPANKGKKTDEIAATALSVGKKAVRRTSDASSNSAGGSKKKAAAAGGPSTLASGGTPMVTRPSKFKKNKADAMNPSVGAVGGGSGVASQQQRRWSGTLSSRTVPPPLPPPPPLALVDVADDHPQRIYNPLTELATTSKNVAATCDLLPLLDLYFHTDTFSLSYLARLLGAQNVPARATTEGPEVLPAVLEFVNPPNDPIYAVPALGTFVHTWRQQQQQQQQQQCDDDDQHLLGNCRDPLYVTLQHDAGLVSRLQPITSLQRPKLMECCQLAAMPASVTHVLRDLTVLNDAASMTLPEWTLQLKPDNVGTGGSGSGGARMQLVIHHHVVAQVVYGFGWYPTTKDGQLAELLGQVMDVELAMNTTTAPTTRALLDTGAVDAAAEKTLFVSWSKMSPDAVGKDGVLATIMLQTLVLDHFRKAAVWYALWPSVPAAWQGVMQRCFRYTSIRAHAPAASSAAADDTILQDPPLSPKQQQQTPVTDESSRAAQAANGAMTDAVAEPAYESPTCLVDLHKSSTRFALLACRNWTATAATSNATRSSTPATTSVTRRWLVHLPFSEDVRAALDDADAAMQLDAKKDKFKNAFVGVRATLAQDRDGRDEWQLRRLSLGGNDYDAVGRPTFAVEPEIHLLRGFALPPPASNNSEADEDGKADELLQVLRARQDELYQAETALEPKIRELMMAVVDARIKYECPDAVVRRKEETDILARHQKLLEQQKKEAEDRIRQLEQDMDAVCAICDDGEVEPGNQIIFCETCNVAVHQMCYGIERIPEGDYYCIACRHPGRRIINMFDDGIKRDLDPRSPALPLNIRCELCCVRKGAYTQTAMPTKTTDTGVDPGNWVHVVCAKWQGLNFVKEGEPELVEDVTELKRSFRRLNIKCHLCQAEYGGMNRCSQPNCKNWIHVTCARYAGLCDVTHGENLNGPVENGWTLKCPEHTDPTSKNVSSHAVQIEVLVDQANDFPPEPFDKEPMARIPFNTANGHERRRLCTDPDYEKALLVELTQKKFSGARCEMCDTVEENTANMTRCTSCSVMVCSGCQLDIDGRGSSYKCPSCAFVATKAKAGEETPTPQCFVCYQPFGWLRPAFAKPFSRKTLKHRKDLSNSYFKAKLWIHSVCVYWNDGLSVDPTTGVVDCSNIVMADGKRVVTHHKRCFLCGHYGGLKQDCTVKGCEWAAIAENEPGPVSFHATCARDAGLEVNTDDTNGTLNFYIRCYRHGDNDFNLRAKIEDMILVEERRSGKNFSKIDAPMTFSHASRLLNSAIVVMRMLGWSWRWAEWWVDYNSTWEPLLELGQKEEKMTQEQLKIVPSSRESRASDARRCRLAAFGVALRNRSYDTDDGFDRNSLNNALRAVLHTKSLVGPLEDFEIDFLLEWLGLAYRSKSRVLGYGKHAIDVEPTHFTMTFDGRRKFELCGLPFPGKQSSPDDNVFETPVDDPVDYLKTDPIGEEICSPKKASTKRSRSAAAASPDADSETLVSKAKRKRDHGRSKGSNNRKLGFDVEGNPVTLSRRGKRLGRPPKRQVPLKKLPPNGRSDAGSRKTSSPDPYLSAVGQTSLSPRSGRLQAKGSTPKHEGEGTQLLRHNPRISHRTAPRREEDEALSDASIDAAGGQDLSRSRRRSNEMSPRRSNEGATGYDLVKSRRRQAARNFAINTTQSRTYKTEALPNIDDVVLPPVEVESSNDAADNDTRLRILDYVAEQRNSTVKDKMPSVEQSSNRCRRVDWSKFIPARRLGKELAAHGVLENNRKRDGRRKKRDRSTTVKLDHRDRKRKRIR